MQRVSSGYTIIEVLIFLAISGVLILSSIFFLSGREASNQFAASMRDMQSKMQDWINDATTGFAGSANASSGLGTANCNTPSQGGRPRIMASGGGPNTPDCIFLGKAIQFTDDNSPPTSGQESKVYAYPIFGTRVNPSGDLVSNLTEAMPVAADGVGNNGTAKLTEEFDLGGSTKVLSIKSAGGTSHMAAFFLSLGQQTIGINGNEDLAAWQYNLPSNALPANQDGPNGDVEKCVDMISPCGNPVPLQNWQICFGNGNNNDTAVLTVSSDTGLGATTDLVFKACS